MVMQQANMAMMLMGKVARPDTGEITKDLQAARYFIDQLEMLEAKTKGNLSKEESGLLKQTLMSCQMTFRAGGGRTRWPPRHRPLLPRKRTKPKLQRPHRRRADAWARSDRRRREQEEVFEEILGGVVFRLFAAAGFGDGWEYGRLEPFLRERIVCRKTGWGAGGPVDFSG